MWRCFVPGLRLAVYSTTPSSTSYGTSSFFACSLRCLSFLLFQGGSPMLFVLLAAVLVGRLCAVSSPLGLKCPARGLCRCPLCCAETFRLWELGFFRFGLWVWRGVAWKMVRGVVRRRGGCGFSLVDFILPYPWCFRLTDRSAVQKGTISGWGPVGGCFFSPLPRPFTAVC